MRLSSALRKQADFPAALLRAKGEIWPPVSWEVSVWFLAWTLGCGGKDYWEEPSTDSAESAQEPGAEPGEDPMEDLDGNGVPDAADCALSFGPSFHSELSLDGQPFSRICAGTFVQGCTEEQAEAGGCSSTSIESPAHTIILTRDVYLAQLEVTQGEFSDLMGYLPPSLVYCQDCPISSVSWHEAAAYAALLSLEAGLSACYQCSGAQELLTCERAVAWEDCEGYRLPTESEWEAAARCGETHPWAGSSIVEAVAWHWDNSRGEAQPVGSLEPNACQLFDMSGNQGEWVEDAYREYSTEVLTDPVGEIPTDYGVSRGGHWGSTAEEVQLAIRQRAAASDRFGSIGFRLARSTP